MIVAICGGSCSGKSTMAGNFRNACIVSMDDFYKGKSRMNPPYNFDEPEAIDLTRLAELVGELKSGAEQVSIPRYNMKTSEPEGAQKLENKQFVVVEGIFTLYTAVLRELCDLKIFLDVPQEERLRRRIARDVIKGRTEAESRAWSINVERMHDLYVEPQKKYADLVIPFKL